MRYLTSIIILISSHLSYSQCDTVNNFIINGSFTSSEGTNITAPGWTPTSTPDINDEIGLLNSTPGYVWSGTPLTSPSGGTWQNLFDLERVAQTVNLTSGQVYSLCFDYAAQGIYSSSYTFIDPVGIDVYIYGILTYTSDDDTTPYTWETACFNFTAATTNTLIEFSASKMAYVAIDAACLNQSLTNSIVNVLEDYSGISVSPNPFLISTTIKFINPLNNPFIFTLYNSQGSIEYTVTNITTDQIFFERNDLAKGLYLFQLRSESQKASYRGRLIIR